MKTYDQYEFDVQVWLEEGDWHYSVVQEFGYRNSSEIQPLGYGTTETPEQAFEEASKVVKDYFS